ncbi:MAG: glycoside hydrolase family 3 N-terminal domain-containing protein [Luteibacter sp.]|uniref:glycoside hydrolase family 3 N-terminal domain-containing protein n=1 Tax=Luteibacter sp. TaxID=1886636 RepID=UPI0028081866|nr:glycoside hydrolase family 3 N-terminal domain-containing protein [Luteibacter sp.]MDQ7996641.1 glycoside hydrolase family 3 N-terminal domain-containing protein [Luteibacter sp.]MDQ8049636.1 glycoside hydrolase family 3 N-terminal domain-containing protein [Luteibacter sp.]
MPYTVRLTLCVALLGTATAPVAADTALPADMAARPSNAQIASPDIGNKVDALLARMTLQEKIGQLVQYAAQGASAGGDNDAFAPNPETRTQVDTMALARRGQLGSVLNLVGAEKTRPFQEAALKSRLGIPLLFGADIIHGYRTIYPIPLALSATWDPRLVQDLSRMAALEATGGGVKWVFSPMVDISRDARWGRSAEGAGEDAYLGSAMARAYILGYQGDDLASPDSVAASVKHFAAYGAAEAGREYNTTDMSDVRLRQVYLPPYRAAVEAGAATMMSAFNALNGVPATADPYLMTDVLRKEWGFNGFVVSDYTAIMELTHHGIASDAAAATRKALEAGVEMDMMSHYYDTQIPVLLEQGKLSMATVDEAVRRVLRVKFALGLFEHPYARTVELKAPAAANHALARRAAEESFVLLKNDRVGSAPLLPLGPGARKVALIGPLAYAVSEMQGPWGGARTFDDFTTVRKGLAVRMKAQGGELIYAKGTGIDDDSDAGFAEALKAAAQADVVVMALGEAADMSGEAGARAHLGLPGNQQKLLEQVVATGKPVVLLVFSGRPLVLAWADAHVPAIMAVWFPGAEAGNAVANVLFGDVAPSGKLTMSFPYTEGQEPLYYNALPTGRPAGDIDTHQPPSHDTTYVSRYIDAPNDALYPFGYGLSYTTFSYSDVRVSRASVPLAEANRSDARKLVTVTATVTNTGRRAATEVAQLYVRNVGASVSQPVRGLQGFQRVPLQPGESKRVSFQLGFPELSFWNARSRQVVEATRYTVWVGGSSRAEQEAVFTIAP